MPDLPTFAFLTDPAETLPYQALTFPRFQAKLQDLAPDVVVLGASINQQPVGLIIGEIYNHKDDPDQPPTAWIHSLFVPSSHRRQGIGRSLLRQMTAQLQQQSCAKIRLRYLDSFKTLPLQWLLKQEGWTCENTGTICYASKSQVAKTPAPNLFDYLDRLTPDLPPGYEIFPWVNLTASDRAAINAKMAANPLYKKFNPFIEESKLEPINSLGLRQGENIVGWMIAHRLNPETIRYTQLFVDPETQGMGPGLLLLLQSIRLQLDATAADEDTSATFNFEPSNPTMTYLVNRLLKSGLTDIRKAYTATKILTEY